MKQIFAVAMALSMLAAPAAMADQRPGNSPQMNHDQGGQYHGQQNNGPQNNGPQGSQYYRSQNQGQAKPAPKPQYSYNGRKYDAVRGPKWDAPKGYDAHRHWSRGQKLPSSYRNRGYVVDYRAYHLKQPPRGYNWVRVDNNVYLVSMQNGLISQIVLSLFY